MTNSHDDGHCYKNRTEQCQTSPIYTTATKSAGIIDMNGRANMSDERRKEWEGGWKGEQ